jgi:glutamate synthase (ferredoxin)
LRQVFVEHLEGVQGAELEREMFILRKLIEKEKTTRIAAAGGDPADFYICTMSNRTIVYKARTCACRGCARKFL